MATELAPAAPRTTAIPRIGGNGEALQNLDTLERLIPAAVERRALEWLHFLESRANVAMLYEARKRNAKLANRCARLQIEAEAAIGAVDLMQHPPLSSEKIGPLTIGAETISTATRTTWRSLGAAYQRNALALGFERLDAAGIPLSPEAMRRWVQTMGYSFVPASAFRSALQDRRERGATYRELEAVCGTTDGVLARIFAPAETRIRWGLAQTIARGLEIDPSTLPPAPPEKGRGRARKPLWLRRERKPTRSRFDKCYAEFRACLATFAQVAPGQERRWDKAYEHFYAIEEILGNAMKCEAGYLDAAATIAAERGRR